MKLSEAYRTILHESQGYVKEQGSKFYAFAFPIANEDEVNSLLLKCKERQPGATHYCFAWRLGIKGNNFRVSDDGEPGNSAGQPIFRQIQSYNLTNVLVVVARFFGGKKLGIPGLIASYGGAALDALSNSNILEMEPTVTLSIREITRQDFKIYELANRYNVAIIKTPNEVGGKFSIEVKLVQWSILQSALKELPNFDWQLSSSDSEQV